MNTLNSKVVKTFSSPFAQTYTSINDIKFRHNLDGVSITSTQGNTETATPQLPSRPQRKVVKRNATKKPSSLTESVSVSSLSSSSSS